MPVMALKDGSDCWAGDSYPPKDKKVDDSFCDINCQGFPDEKCKWPSESMEIHRRASANGHVKVAETTTGKSSSQE